MKSPRLVDAFLKIDRKNFVPREYAAEAYGNYPLPIGEGQTISQPLTVAFMLELLAPRLGDKILEIGAGSGWQSALIAYCVSAARINADQNADKRGSSGHVVAIERIPALKKMAERNISKYNFIEKGIVRVILGDGSRGYPEDAPYDKIIAAAAGTEVPNAWKWQLKVGGRIVAPVGQSIIVLDKIPKRGVSAEGGPAFGWQEKEYFGFSFVPLIRENKE